MKDTLALLLAFGIIAFSRKRNTKTRKKLPEGKGVRYTTAGTPK